MPSLRTRTAAPTIVTDDIPLPPAVPELPDDVLKRFPSLAKWEEDVDAWWTRAQSALQTNQHVVSQSVTKANRVSGDIFVSINGLTASVATETAARISADGVLAQRIVTVSAIAGVSQNIKIQNAAPVGPALNDYWIDNTDLTLPVTYQWSGAAWVEVTTPISVAAVAVEQAARVAADGFLEGKYTLTVSAGNVVTGMNITSSTGGGTNISDVTFVAANFKIYNGTTGVTMFNVSGATVQLAGTLTVSTSGRVFVGTGNYANADTAWYVDSTGQFSLKDKLTWNGTTLSITGSLTATTGAIGGWVIAATSMTDAAGAVGMSSAVTGGDDIRFWAGNATPASAPFRVTEAGVLTASSGKVGGWTLAATTLSANNAVLDSAGQLALGTGNDIAIISATNASYRVWIGNATAGSATFSVTKAGALYSTSGTIGGFTIGATSLSAGAGTNYVLLSTLGTTGIGVGSGGGVSSIARMQVASAGYTGFYLANTAGNVIGVLRISDAGGDTSLILGGGWSYSAEGVQLNGFESKLLFGAIGSADTNIHRSTTNTLKTDSLFVFGGQISGEVARFQGLADSSNNKTFCRHYLSNPGHWWDISNEDNAGTGATQNGFSFNCRNGSGAPVRVFYLEPGAYPWFGTYTASLGLTASGYITIKDINGNVRNLLCA